MNWRAMLAYRPSESTILGIAAIVCSVAGVLSHQATWPQAMPLIAGGVSAILLPGNAAAKVAGQATARDVIAAMQPGASAPAVTQAIAGDVLAFEKATAGQTQT